MTEPVAAPSNILDKIAKLLALAEGQATNPNEAAVAAARAAELMERHQLDRAAIDERDTEDGIIEDADPIVEGFQPANWATMLAINLSRMHGVKAFWMRYRVLTKSGPRARLLHRLCLVGRKPDVAIVKQLHGYLTREIDRLCEDALDWGAIRGKSGAMNFRTGAVLAVLERLDAMRVSVRQGYSETAIVRLDSARAEVEDWFEQKHKNAGARRVNFASATDDRARFQGYLAGRSIALDAPSEPAPSAPTIAAPQHALPTGETK